MIKLLSGCGLLRVVTHGVVTGALGCALVGCESVRENLGMAKKGPDEFAEGPLATKELQLPPSFHVLPSPQKQTDPFPPEPQTSSAQAPLTPGAEALAKKLGS
jgi:hypothetical protein